MNTIVLNRAWVTQLLLWPLIWVQCAFLSGCSEIRKSTFAFSNTDNVDFNFEVRPILVQKCYLCHGPDPKSRKANLRLDTFEGATASLKGGHKAVVPGDIEASMLVRRIYSKDPEMIMPTAESHLTLTEKEKDVLKKWIEEGAKYEKHWAFEKPKSHVSDEPVEKRIDDYVAIQLRKRGLDPAPKADKNILIRRVSYLLTGLPPTASEIARFQADNNEKAYEKMVDQYLNAPGYGEVWARHWMDIVRYAETKGHEFDFSIQGAWRYRDYLIRAFNQDVPYDQFVREHLAGDLLPNVRRDPVSGINESVLGTAFFNLGEGAHSPVDVRKDEADRIDNVIDVTTKAFQGLTVACSRCHDHKFDPISAEDYYGLFGVLESTRFSPKVAERSLAREKDESELKGLKKYIVNHIATDWRKSSASPPVSRYVSDAIVKDTAALYRVLGDFRGRGLGLWRSDGFAFGTTTTLGQPVFKDDKIRVLQDGKASSRLYGMGKFGALRSPNFIIDKNFIGVRALGKGATIRVIVDNYQLIRWPIYDNLDQEVDTLQWRNFTFNVGRWKGHNAYIEVMPGRYNDHVYKLKKDRFVEVQYAIAFESKWPEIKPLKLTASASLATSVQRWKENRFDNADVELINSALRRKTISGSIPGIAPMLEKEQLLANSMIDSSFFDGVVDGFSIDSPVFVRGDYQMTSKNKVPRKFIDVLINKREGFKSLGSGRLELANAIVNRDNPLTARVMVNRIWYYLFGRGIVETVDNFGLQGKLPSNPALLDLMATEYQRNGWSTRKLMRAILLTDTFQRSVETETENSKIDPENIYLASYPKRRLEAEMIRDGLLATAGNLNNTMYGASVPVHISSFMNGRGKPSTSGPLDGQGRRSVYQEVRRNFLDPTMTTFDRPIPFTTFGSRNVTTVPAQSLVLMNDPFVIHEAGIMAKKVVSLKAHSFEKKIDWIFLRAFARQPSEQEIENARKFIFKMAKLKKIKESAAITDVGIWKDYCHSIFNLKEFVYLI
jgi:hypothetical protein